MGGDRLRAVVAGAQLQVLLRVQEDFLNAALDAVDADYGGMPIYLERELRVGEAERRRLEALYLAS